MKKLAKILATLLLVALVLLVAVGLSFDWLAKQAMLIGLRNLTGSAVTLGKVEVGLRAGTFRLERLVLLNPPEFGGGPLLDLPELFLEYDQAAAATNALRFKLVRVDLAELGLAVDAQGRTNIHALGGALKELQKAEQKRRAARSAGFTGIDTLTVSLGKMTSIDLRPPGKTNVFVLGLRRETLRNVRTEADLAPLLFKLVFSGALKGLPIGL